MFRAPIFFAIAWLAGLCELLSQTDSTDIVTIYTIVSGGVLAGFAAVWVKLWQMHSDWKADKNATIAELKQAIKELELELKQRENHHD